MNKHYTRSLISRLAYTMVLILILLTTACGIMPQDKAKKSIGDPATISFAVWEYEHSLYQALIEQFKTEHPEITVVLLPLEDMIQEAQTSSSSSLRMVRQVVSRADTSTSTWITPEAFDSNLLLNLEPLMEEDPTFNRDDFYPGALQKYATQDGIWVLPREFYVQILAYNKDLFAAAGVPEPEQTWTWEDLLDIAEQLATAPANGDDTYGFVDPANGMLAYFGLIESRGIDLLMADPTTVQLDSEEVIASMDRMQELVANHAIYRQEQDLSTEITALEESQRRIAEGKVGIWDDDFGRMQYDTEDQAATEELFAFEMGRVAYPAINSSPLGDGEGYIISRGTQHPQAAWAWIEFLSRQQMDEFGVSGGRSIFHARMIPARDTLAKKLDYWARLDETTAETYRQALLHYTMIPRKTPSQLISGLLVQAVGQILDSENADTAQIMATAQQTFEQQFAMAPAEEVAVEEQEPFVVATPVSQQAPEGSTQITFSATNFNPSDLRRIVQQFQETHPDVFIQIQSANTFAGPLSLASMAQSTDCFATSAYIQGDADANALQDITPFFSTDSILQQLYYPAMLLEQYTYQDRLLGLPYGFDMRTLTYNQTAFDKAGVALPEAGWTPDDFLDAAKKLTQGEGDEKQYGYVPLGMSFEDLFFFIRQFGGQPFVGSGEQVQPNFTDPQVVEAIQWYIDLAQVHEVMPPITFPHKRDDPYHDESYNIIQSGRAAMWFDYGYGMFRTPVPGMEQQMDSRDFTVQIASLPIGGGGLSGDDISFSSVLFLSNNTTEAQTCWDWFAFLTQTPDLIQWSVPANMAVAKSPEFLNYVPSDTANLVDVYEDTLNTAIDSAGYQPPQEYTETYWFFAAINRAIAGDAPLSEALADAQETTLAFLACVLDEEQRPGVCAREVDPSYQGFLQ